ncbi:MAG: hypothetical protein WAJ91_08095, partial [Rhodoplanes sp.]
MNEADRDRAAEFTLGLLTAGEQTRFAQTADADPSLAKEIARWDDAFALLVADGDVAPPPDMFDRIQNMIASRSRHLPGTLTVRAAEG